MNDVTKAIAYFLTVLTIGGIIIFISKQGESEGRMQAAMMQAGNVLNNYARNKCSEEASKHIHQSLYSPSDVSGDRMDRAILTWKGYQGTNYKLIVCDYKRGDGIQSLVIDGETIIPAAAQPASTQEKTPQKSDEAAQETESGTETSSGS